MRFGCLPILAIVAVVFFVVAVPVFLAVMSFMSMAMPWLLFGVAAWVILRATSPRPGRRWNRLEWRQSSSANWVGSRQWQPARQAMPATPTLPVAPPVARPELPIDVQVKVEQIKRKAEVLLGYQSRFPPYSKDLYLVRQTVKAIGGFIRSQTKKSYYGGMTEWTWRKPCIQLQPH